MSSGDCCYSERSSHIHRSSQMKLVDIAVNHRHVVTTLTEDNTHVRHSCAHRSWCISPSNGSSRSQHQCLSVVSHHAFSTHVSSQDTMVNDLTWCIWHSTDIGSVCIASLLGHLLKLAVCSLHIFITSLADICCFLSGQSFCWNLQLSKLRSCPNLNATLFHRTITGSENTL